ncbi:phosphoethanolamine transferase [Rhodobacter calidifons]|uniref:Phosphoethanolamine--lipid A transferase n=1 Tax=Rhodobacter calidifons TaxID=2715277 RepID=A0ABX0G4V3_9RHOB|nr:phosphoethanolamine--lipid A transferase [Rhodobacter calidifons]NHB76253.1 phosphoethanolamine--lipid A transferase [Rhodobacter calidifons]
MIDPTQAAGNGRRPSLSPALLNALVATWLLALCNATFWGHLFRIFAGRTVTALVFAGAVWALLLLVISLLALRRMQKPVLVALLMIAGVSSYYVDVLGVVIDREMIQNAMTTTFAESKHLITPQFLAHVALYGVLPSALVLWVRIRRAPALRAAAGAGLMLALSAALVAGLLFTNLKAYSTVLRAEKELLGAVQPLAPLSGALRYARMMMKSTQVVLQPTGRDAGKGPYLSTAGKPVLMVIVAGETGRAQNWSLGGYARQTNPELAARDILYFPQATSCGTATATSLPCMFSPLGQADYSYEGGLSHENLLDVLSHAGFRVEWWDNNTGDKNIADRIPRRTMTAADGADFCQPECIDGVFLKALAEKAATITEDTVIVLHQIGSHGPSDWLRYPADREIFAPACKTPELTDCTAEEIVNAYDNTIAYTDHVLAEVIDLLDGSDRVIPALYYVSDHGESLGEGGLYLHGTPYFMAPDNQTRVPMVIWMSERFRASLGLDRACLAARTDAPVSHDNMFSTVLGMLNVTTSARDDALDIAGACRRGTG